MKAHHFVSAALVLLNAIPSVLSAEPQLRGVILVTDFEDQLDLYDSKDEEEDYSGDFEMEPSEEEFYNKFGHGYFGDGEEEYGYGGGRGGGDNCRGNRHPYALDEEFDSSEDEDFEMEPSEEEFYNKHRGSGGRKQTNVGSSGGNRGDASFCKQWADHNCGSCGQGRCTWTDSGCVPRRGGGGYRGPYSRGEQ